MSHERRQGPCVLAPPIPGQGAPAEPDLGKEIFRIQEYALGVRLQSVRDVTFELVGLAGELPGRPGVPAPSRARQVVSAFTR